MKKKKKTSTTKGVETRESIKKKRSGQDSSSERSGVGFGQKKKRERKLFREKGEKNRVNDFYAYSSSYLT